MDSGDCAQVNRRVGQALFGPVLLFFLMISYNFKVGRKLLFLEGPFPILILQNASNRIQNVILKCFGKTLP